jgi:hypothetical protein
MTVLHDGSSLSSVQRPGNEENFRFDPNDQLHKGLAAASKEQWKITKAPNRMARSGLSTAATKNLPIILQSFRHPTPTAKRNKELDLKNKVTKKQ